ncbi:MAG: flippase [Candidatus Aminicenantes bacterium]|nr:flippase [Candidatus Aminicenantes bacterium]
MYKKFNINGPLLVKNTGLNFIGQVAPLFIALLTVPFVIRGLGTERYGILSLAGVFFGIFYIMDLGLTKATVQFVSSALGEQKEERIPFIVWTSLLSQLFLGILSGVVLYFSAPWLSEKILKVPPELVREARLSFVIISFFIPAIMASIMLRGILEARQRFDLVNAVRIPQQGLTYIMPLLGILLGVDLPGIILMILLPRIGGLIAHFYFCLSLFPSLKRVPKWDRIIFRSLISFGGWIALGNIIIPFFIYLDRFMIGSLSSMTSVGYYSVAFDVVFRLQVFPTSFVLTLFPAFSSLKNDPQRLRSLYLKSLKFLLLVFGPVIFLLFLFAGELFTIWLGADLAVHVVPAFRFLVLSFFFSALGQISAHLINGIGRPDIPTKVFAVLLPVFAALLWIFISRGDIVGAALARLIFEALKFLLLFCLAWRQVRMQANYFWRSHVLQNFFILGSVITISFFLFQAAFVVHLGVACCTMGLFLGYAWFFSLDREDKKIFFDAANSLLKFRRKS